MMKGIGVLAGLVLVVVIVLVAIGAYAWLTVSKYVHPGSGGSGIKTFSANRTGTLSQVMGNMTSGFNTSQFAVSYAGNATIDIYGLQLSAPLSLSVARYYNDSRIDAVVSGIPVIGNLSIIQIKNGSRYYSCNIKVNNSKRSYDCYAEQGSNSIFSALNLSSGNSQGLGGAVVRFSDLNQSSYNGMPCTNIGGYINYANATELNKLNTSSRIGQKVSSANVTFIGCVSNAGRIPLTFRAYVVATNSSSKFSAGLQMRETEFSRNSSAAITELPGPVLNSTR
jgi:hypothetical protein